MRFTEDENSKANGASQKNESESTPEGKNSDSHTSKTATTEDKPVTGTEGDKAK